MSAGLNAIRRFPHLASIIFTGSSLVFAHCLLASTHKSSTVDTFFIVALLPITFSFFFLFFNNMYVRSVILPVVVVLASLALVHPSGRVHASKEADQAAADEGKVLYEPKPDAPVPDLKKAQPPPVVYTPDAKMPHHKPKMVYTKTLTETETVHDKPTYVHPPVAPVAPVAPPRQTINVPYPIYTRPTGPVVLPPAPEQVGSGTVTEVVTTTAPAVIVRSGAADFGIDGQRLATFGLLSLLAAAIHIYP